MHSRRPLIYIVLCFAAGILLSRWIHWPPAVMAALAIFLIFLTLPLRRYSWITRALVLLIFICAGMVYTNSRSVLPADHIIYKLRKYRSEVLSVKGVIVSDIQQRSSLGRRKTVFTLQVTSIKRYDWWQPVVGKILVNIFDEADLAYGDYINITGTVYRPFNFSGDEKFSYRSYLANQGIYYLMSLKRGSVMKVVAHDEGNPLMAASLRLKERLKKILSTGLTKNEAALMNAFLLGDRTDIPRHIKDLFVQTGTAHILAISGLNVGIVAVLFLVFLKMLPVPRLIQLFLTITLLIGYAFLTGASPSVVRATIMTCVFLTGFILEKNPDTLNSLFLAAFLILLWSPLNLFDVGFQLSFVCVLAILLVSMKLGHHRAEDFPEPSLYMLQRFTDFLAVSLAVWFGVAGMIAYYFKIITPVTVLANLIIVPLSTGLVVLGFGMLLSAVIVPLAAMPFACCIKLALNLMVGIVYWFAQWPWAYIYLDNIKIWMIAIYYLAFSIVIMLPWPKRWPKAFIIGAMKINRIIGRLPLRLKRPR